MQFRVTVTVCLHHLVKEVKCLRTLPTDGTVMNFQHIVNQQVKRPGTEVGRGASATTTAAFTCFESFDYVFGGHPCSPAGFRELHFAVAAEVDAETTEYFSRRKVGGNDLSYAFLCIIHILFPFLWLITKAKIGYSFREKCHIRYTGAFFILPCHSVSPGLPPYSSPSSL